MNEDGLSTRTPPASGRDDTNAALLSDLSQVEENKNPFNSLGLFLVTLVLFFTAGIVSSDIREIAILIGVLLFHELGHLAAMKALGYRDVKMFFIPFLGAAVTGNTDSNSAVKSCFVSVLGPLPGVAMAVVFQVLFMWTDNFYFFKTAQIMLILNVFNMLPIMPLDGGRYIDVLFVRNRHFRFAFSIFGVACFLALAFFEGNVFLGLVAFLSLVASWNGLKTNLIARRMNDGGMTERSFKDVAGSPAAFDFLVSQLKSAFPKAFFPELKVTLIHTHLLNVLESARFVPAGWMAKVFLSALYGVFLLSSVSLAFLFLAMNYHEKLKVTTDDSIINERYLFGDKVSESALNKKLLYHGMGVKFGKDTSVVTGLFEYENGYRVGRYIRFGEGSDTVEITHYTKGRIDSIIEFKEGVRKKISPEEKSLFSRLGYWLSEKFQPRTSNHKHFGD